MNLLDFAIGAAAGLAFGLLTSSPYFLGMKGKLEAIEAQVVAIANKVGAEVKALKL